MKNTVNSKEFFNAIAKIKTIAKAKTKMPILSHVKISIYDSSIVLLGTDLENTIEINLRSLSVVGGSQNKEICVDARALYDLAKILSKGKEISLTIDGQKLIVNNTTIAGVDASEFPNVIFTINNTIVGLDYSANRAYLSDCLRASSQDETRYNLNCVCLNSKGLIRATNGHKLAQRSIKLLAQSDSFKTVMISRKFLELVEKFKDAGKIWIVKSDQDNELSCFEGSNFRLFSKVIDGEFPDCDQVLPKQAPNATVKNIDKNILESLLIQACQIVTDKEKGVKITVSAEDNRLKVEASSARLGQFSDSMNGLKTDSDLTLGLNAIYMLDFLKGIPSASKITFKSYGPLAPVIFSGPDYGPSDIDVIMPMRC